MDYLSHLSSQLLDHWVHHAVDRDRGGFHGRLGADWHKVSDAPKGLVQHARFLWAFSAAYARTRKPEYRQLALHAREFLLEHFRDRTHGGFYYTVSAEGRPLDRRKHVYPHSFVVYAFAECARALGDAEALDEALATFCLIDAKAHDEKFGGYLESFSESWDEIDQHEDMGVAGRRKSMNTHIHLLEAMTALVHASVQQAGFADELLRSRLAELLEVCTSRIYNPTRRSLDLFFERDWTRLVSPTSYGHDIEFSWLLDEAAGLLRKRKQTKPVSLALAENTLKALGKDGSLFYEGTPRGSVNDRRRVWWVQAEGLVGFLNAFLVSKESRYRRAFKGLERWVTTKQVDHEFGEWHEELSSRGKPAGEKGHLWREPYHQVRACLEVERRLKKLRRMAK